MVISRRQPWRGPFFFPRTRLGLAQRCLAKCAMSSICTMLELHCSASPCVSSASAAARMHRECGKSERHTTDGFRRPFGLADALAHVSSASLSALPLLCLATQRPVRSRSLLHSRARHGPPDYIISTLPCLNLPSSLRPNQPPRPSICIVYIRPSASTWCFSDHSAHGRLGPPLPPSHHLCISLHSIGLDWSPWPI